MGRLSGEREAELPRLVLLADPAQTPLAPLLEALLLAREESTQALWRSGRLETLTLRDALSGQ